jgi:signal transduction histidine kinase
VFDRFFRLDSSRSQASGGTGLGLAIVQSIMLLHGGKVEIASQLGQGTRVTLHLPIAAEQGRAAALPNRHMTKT